MVIARFADERIPFLPRDCLPLPIRNVTIEELAGLLLERLKERPEVAAWDLHSIQIGVSSDVGQWAYSESERG
jgi:6-pyruvoyltetrahydropterin/6-carboxytetrahydropterin synthase